MSRRYLCVTCWREREVEELDYTCPRCAAGDDDLPFFARGGAEEGRRPVASLGRRRGWLRGLFTEDSEPVCRRHPEAKLQLYCPAPCGAPITAGAEIGRGGAYAIGFAGPKSAGKTLFTTAAVRALRDARSERGKVSLLGLADTEERFGAFERTLFADRRKLPATDKRQRAGEESFAWELAVVEDGARRRGRDALLAVHDLAGEVWGMPSHEPHETLDRYLDHLGGIVFLVDGAALADDLHLESRDAWDSEPRAGDRGEKDRQWLRWLIERLGDRTRDVDLALTVSKGDLLWSNERWAGLEPVETRGGNDAGEDAGEEGGGTTLLEEALGVSGRGSLPETARARFRRTGLFVASSLGFRPGPGDVDAGGRLARPPEPRGVSAPVLWLLAQRIRGLQ